MNWAKAMEVRSGSRRYHAVMIDSLTVEERSLRMAAVKHADTAPELALRSALHGLGFRFSLLMRDFL